MREIEGVQPGTLDADTCAGTPKSAPPERGSPEWIAAWKCAGCGVVMADLHRICDCPTSCVGRGGRGYSEIAIKIDPPEPELIDVIREALEDSMGPDWTMLDGARRVAEALAERGITRPSRADAREHSSPRQVSPPIREALSPTVNPIQEKT